MARPAGRNEPPVLLVKWYDVTKWLLGRVDSFPKNQRFIFGQRIADRALNVLEALVEAAYSHRKTQSGSRLRQGYAAAARLHF